MTFTFFPTVHFEGLPASNHLDAAVFMPVENLVLAIEKAGGTHSIRKYHIVVDIDQAALDALLPGLTGWTAQAVQRTNNVSAFEGMLAYHFDQKNNPDA